MVTTKLNLSMTEPQVRQIYAKQGDTGRVLDITLDQTPEDGTLRILRPDGVEVTSEAVTGGEVSESGETVTFESLTEADVTELTVGIEPVQDLSNGDPSPTNICPITGHDEVTVTRTGKNLIDYDDSPTALVDTPSVLLPKGTYYVYVSAVSTSFNSFAQISTDGTNFSNIDTDATVQTAYADRTMAYSSKKSKVTVVSPVYFRVKLQVNGNVSGTRIRVMLTNDSTDYNNIPVGFVTGNTYFEGIWTPYVAPNTYTTSLGQTVYGGILDLVSGVLTVDRAMVDLGSLSWSMSGSGNTAFFYANTASLGVASDITTSLNYICENYSIVAVSSGGTATGMAFTSASQLRIRDATYSDATSFKTAMNGVQLVYQLATPVEYQLTPQQIKTLVGTNNVWASSGDIVNITFTYGGLLSELPSEATEIVGKCYCDIEQNGVSSMPFTLNVKKNERQ